MGSLRESMTSRTTMREVVEKEIGEEVVVAAALSQGPPPSPLSLVTPISDEDGNDTGADIRGVIASWNRDEVTAIRAAEGDGGTLQIPGATIPVFDRSLGDPRELELFLALGA